MTEEQFERLLKAIADLQPTDDTDICGELDAIVKALEGLKSEVHFLATAMEKRS